MLSPHDAAIKLDETANEYQHKVEMYYVALIFTIAGLAIQSGKPTEQALARYQQGGVGEFSNFLAAVEAERLASEGIDAEVIDLRSL